MISSSLELRKPLQLDCTNREYEGGCGASARSLLRLAGWRQAQKQAGCWGAWEMESDGGEAETASRQRGGEGRRPTVRELNTQVAWIAERERWGLKGCMPEGRG